MIGEETKTKKKKTKAKKTGEIDTTAIEEDMKAKKTDATTVVKEKTIEMPAVDESTALDLQTASKKEAEQICKKRKKPDVVIDKLEKKALSAVSKVGNAACKKPLKPHLSVEHSREQVRCREADHTSWSLSWKANRDGAKEECMKRARAWFAKALN